jgi:pyruvate/2-oxoglutarate dehydrogenase complex dihydrolipoamide dehydrogenase (E3) component
MIISRFPALCTEVDIICSSSRPWPAVLLLHGKLPFYVVFIDPQLGRIGLTEKAAKEIGHRYLVAKMPASWVARAIEIDETDGLITVIVDNY